MTSGGPDLTQAGLLSLAALPALRRLTLVACPCATDTTAQQLVEVVRAVVDHEAVAAWRESFPALRDRRDVSALRVGNRME